ncbi:MAG: ribonuclease E inhibitor RraB [Planctomycetota bacterium]
MPSRGSGRREALRRPPRPVDHRMEFPSVEAAELFLEAAQLRGYQPLAHADRGLGEEPFALSLRRVDSVELDHIHRVVMDLVELAAPYDGDHVGWCSSST